MYDEINPTSVFVTHDQEEALEVADRVVVVNHGIIEPVGRPDEIYDKAAISFVYALLGNVNLFEGRVHNGIADVGRGRIHAPEHAHVADSAATTCVRPHDIDIARAVGKDTVEATLNRATRVGSVVRLELSRKDNGAYVEVELSRERFEHLNVTTGNVVHFKPRRARVFLADSSHSNAA